MGEIACRFAIDFYTFHSEAFEKSRHDNASHGIYGIKCHFESGLAHCFHVHCIKGEHCIYVGVCEILFRNGSNGVHSGEIEIVLFCAFEYCGSFFGVQEFAFFIQEFQCVPLFWVMRCCKDDSSVRLFEYYCHFRSRGGGISGLDYVHSAGYQRAAYELFHHLSGNPGILAYYYTVALSCRFWPAFPELDAVGVCEFYDVDRSQSFSRSPADGSADSGNGFDKCHGYCVLVSSFT